MSLIRDIEELINQRSFPFYIAIIFPKISRQEINKLVQRAAIKKMTLKLFEIDENKYKFYARFITREISGYIYTVSDKIWYVLIPGYSKDLLINMVKHVYPLWAFPILSLRSYLNFLNYIAKGYDITIKQCLLRRKSYRDTTKKWLRGSYHTVMRKIEKIIREDKSVPDSFRFIIRIPNAFTFAEIAIDRTGVFSIYDGIPGIHIDLEEVILRSFARIAYEERINLSKLRRSLDEKRKKLYVKTAFIKFESIVTKEDFEKFIEILQRTHYLTIYEKGNPYLHLVAIDKNSGSTYEILANSREARIIPGVSAEVDSLYIILDALYSITTFPLPEI